MKKISIPVLAILIISFVGFSSCQKDQENPPTRTENITKSSWKFSSAVAGGVTITDNPALACMKDDAITFESNGNGNITEGSVVCNPTTAGNFTWTFQNNETQVMMSTGLFPAGSGLFNILSLNETALVISQDVTVPPSTTAINVIATYIH